MSRRLGVPLLALAACTAVGSDTKTLAPPDSGVDSGIGDSGDSGVLGDSRDSSDSGAGDSGDSASVDTARPPQIEVNTESAIAVENTADSMGAGDSSYSPVMPFVFGDFDEDGSQDLLFGRPGASNGDCGHDGGVFLLRGSVYESTDLAAAAATIVGTYHTPFCMGTGDELGNSLASLGDVDGDGVDEVAVGATGYTSDFYDGYEGSVFVFPVPNSGVLTETDAIATFEGFINATAAPYGYAMTGSNVSGGDEDGDGVVDLAIAAYLNEAVYVVTGPFSGTTELEVDATATIDCGGWCAQAMSMHDDVDGDGLDDLFYAGVGLVGFYGPLVGDLGAADADVILPINGVLRTLSGGPVGDLDGDGYVDFATDGNFGDGSKGVYVYSGTQSGTLTDADAVGTLSGGCGSAIEDVDKVSAAGDTDGDGRADLLYGNTYAHTAWLARGPVLGAWAVEDVAVHLTDSTTTDSFAEATAAAGDLDGDGLDDVGIAAPSAGTDAGTEFLFLGKDVGSK